MHTGIRGLLVVLSGTAILGAVGQARPTADVHIVIRDSQSNELLPCRITVLTDGGTLAVLSPQKTPGIAYRTGVIYSSSGEARFTAPAGMYRLFATRGSEYGVATRRQMLTGPSRLEFHLTREVDTTGYIAADTHIHTLTHSGHGDATMLERMATIAGEGIELAVATDHNHHTDYTGPARETHIETRFTPVIGNEVTTSVGHFNAFPVKPGSAVPDFKSSDWQQLLSGIRAVPGVKVVVLNHPSNVHSQFKPTDPKRFHPHSGESLDNRKWDFDGIEVVTSAALQSDIMKPFRDWFALLNNGRRMAGIGSSDSHEVNAYILGQGRTYIRSRATGSDQIDVTEVCDNLKAGRALISMGLFTETWVQNRYGPGDTAHNLPDQVAIRMKVQGPRWVAADRAEVYCNGKRIWDSAIQPRRAAVLKLDSVFRIPRPKHDAWLVAIATGPGIEEPYWPVPRPYQPSSPTWEPRVIGASNPIWLDVDGDGIYTSPAEYAQRAVSSANDNLPRLLESLENYDESVVVQTAALLRAKGRDLNAGPTRAAIDRADPRVRQAIAAYALLVPESD